MAITVQPVLSLLRRLVARPLVVLSFLSLAIVGYVGWQVAEQWFDRPLPASSVAAKRLRMNAAGYQAVLDRLASYRESPSATR